MKKLILYVVGALFLFASCQSDELESNDALAQENDAMLIQALEAYGRFQGKTDWSLASKSPNANQVTRKWTMHYSTGNSVLVPDAGGCSPFELQIDGWGRGSLFGNFTFTNRACFDPSLLPNNPFTSDMLGVGTAAAGDQWYFVRVGVTPDPDNPGYSTQSWIITGGSEGGRFENASGWLDIYGNPTLSGAVFVGWGEFIY